MGIERSERIIPPTVMSLSDFVILKLRPQSESGFKTKPLKSSVGVGSYAPERMQQTNEARSKRIENSSIPRIERLDALKPMEESASAC